MSAIKRYIEELAEKLGINFDEVTEQHMRDDMESSSVCSEDDDSLTEF
jgi:CO/xanthine dehydrogenase Mo-binding subunit